MERQNWIIPSSEINNPDYIQQYKNLFLHNDIFEIERYATTHVELKLTMLLVEQKTNILRSYYYELQQNIVNPSIIEHVRSEHTRLV